MKLFMNKKAVAASSLGVGITAIFLLRSSEIVPLQNPSSQDGELEQRIPSYFRVGTSSESEAQKNWAKALRWRESEGVDLILKAAPEHDHELINHYMPTQIYLGRDNDGNLVAVDR